MDTTQKICDWLKDKTIFIPEEKCRSLQEKVAKDLKIEALLLLLPVEIQRMIFDLLEGQELYPLLSCCTEFRTKINTHPFCTRVLWAKFQMLNAKHSLEYKLIGKKDLFGGTITDMFCAELAKAQALYQSIASALATTALINDAWKRDNCLGKIAQILVTNKRLTDALLVVEKMSLKSKKDCLEEIIKELIQNNDFDTPFTLADRLPEIPKVFFLEHICFALIDNRKYDKALPLAVHIKWSYRRLQSLVKGLIENKKIDEAKVIAELIDGPSEKNAASEEIAIAEYVLGTTKLFPKSKDAWLNLAILQIQWGQIADAINSLWKIRSTQDKDKVREALVYYYLKNHEVDEAIATAENINDFDERSNAFIEIAFEQAKRGSWDSDKVVNHILDGCDDERMAANFVKYLAQAGCFDIAFSLAGTLSAHCRSQAYFYIVDSAVDRGCIPEALKAAELDAENKYHHLFTIAKAQAFVDPAGCKATLEKFWNRLPQSQKEDYIVKLAIAYAKGGDIMETLASLGQLPDTESKIKALLNTIAS